jgi:hypothetical protein
MYTVLHHIEQVVIKGVCYLRQVPDS